jgi:mannose-6-phosphate isomerase-like protein (cupin superfamily)
MDGAKPRIVSKPWGREIWYAHTDTYAGKILEVTRGHLLSLQKHRIKHETLYLLSGRMRFTLEDDVFDWEPRTVVEIPPETVHRMEALEDSVVLEVSTPELDDVVRLDDRYGRVSG